MTQTLRVSLNEASQQRWQEGRLEPKRYEYDLSPEDVVFDVGAYRGEFSAEISSRFGCRIVAVEPTDSILSADWMFAAPDRFRVINKAAGISNNVPIKFGGQYYYSSAFEEPTREYPAIDIADLVREYAEIALMKINVEGMEYDLLPRLAEEGLQGRVRDFQIQFHQIAGLPYEVWYDKICNMLSETHFPTYMFPFCWENWRRR